MARTQLRSGRDRTWVALYESGVHATLVGVMIALILPVYPPKRTEVERAAQLTRAFRQSPPDYARTARRASTARCR